MYPRYGRLTLWERLELDEIPIELGFPVNKIKTRYEVTYNSLGLFGAELFLYIDIKHRILQVLNQADEEAGYPVFLPMTNGNDMPPLDPKFAPELEALSHTLSEFQCFFEDENDPDVVPIRVHLEWCSPKVRDLADLLFKYYTTDFQGIVFVEQRHVAACLARILPRIPHLEHYIRSSQLIGHGASNMAKSQVRGMALKTQQDVVRMFRDREVNLRMCRAFFRRSGYLWKPLTVVATSVAEEGLDFPVSIICIFEVFEGNIVVGLRARNSFRSYPAYGWIHSVSWTRTPEDGYLHRHDSAGAGDPRRALPCLF